MRRSASGFTLVELLLSVGLVGLLTLSIAGVFGLFKASFKTVNAEIEATQRLRIALKQIGDDLSLAYWNTEFDGDGEQSTPLCPTVGTSPPGCWFTVRVLQPGRSASWPESPSTPTLVQVRYTLTNDQLLREVLDGWNADVVYSSRVVLSGLLPYDKNAPNEGSVFAKLPGNLIKVQLKLDGGGEVEDFTASSLFHLRYFLLWD